MTPALAFLVVAAVLIKAGWRNQNVIDTLLGRDTENPHGRVPSDPGPATPQPGGAAAATQVPLVGNLLTGGSNGTVTLAPNALRAGTTLDPLVRGFVAVLSGLAGRPLTIGTATNHDKFVIGTNRVSDHWPDANGVGHAVDIPATGATLTRLGRLALRAAGMPAAQANAATGGVFNVGGWQILFNTNTGGNHFNHLHVGRRH